MAHQYKTQFEMKKLLFVIALFSLMVFNLKAQDGMSFGAKAGLNVSSLGGDAVYSYDSKLGFHIGGVLEIPFSDKIIIQPEALISLQGSGGFFQDDLNFWYLNIPVVAEGVEDEATMKVMREYGIDLCQGFYINKPMPLEAITILS